MYDGEHKYQELKRDIESYITVSNRKSADMSPVQYRFHTNQLA